MIRLVLVVVIAVSALSAAERKAPPWEKTADVGRNLYRQNCIVCHDIEQAETEKIGPSLYRLFQQETLPSGAKPSVEYVRVKTQFGGSEMPAFLQRLTTDRIDQIIDYIRTKD